PNMARARCGTGASLRQRPRRMLLLLPVLCGRKGTARRGNWRNRSSGLAVPLSNIQTDILRLLAAHRNPETYVAGASPLIRDAPPTSSDIELSHDRAEQGAASDLPDTKPLAAAGYSFSWLRKIPLMYTAEVTRGGATPRLEWVSDSDYRFFPT